MAARRTIAPALLVVVSILVAAVLTRHRASQQNQLSSDHRATAERLLSFDKDRSTVPFVYVYMYPKYPAPGDVEVVGGLKVAVWQDGKVMRTRSDAKVGKAYIEARLRPEQLNDLMRLIERSGILATPPDDSGPLHSASDGLKVRTLRGLQAWSQYAENIGPVVRQVEDALVAIEISQGAHEQVGKSLSARMGKVDGHRDAPGYDRWSYQCGLNRTRFARKSTALSCSSAPSGPSFS